MASERLAIRGGQPVRTDPWPRWPIWGPEEERALLEALHSGVWGVGGERVPELERRFAELHRARYAVACCNGTVALQIALVAAGIEAGDEVITSPYTFMATALAILAVGAVPVFVDVERETHNLDPALIDAAVTPRTRAIMPVHIGGRPADMDRILEAARRRGLVVIEDAAQGWLAAWRGTPVGALGDAGTFSFQSSKNLSGGEGGLVLTNDEALYQRAWSYHNCGRLPGGAWYDHATAGLNYRLGEFQAAVLLAGLARLPEQQERRRAAMDALDDALRAIDGLSTPRADDRITAHACHIYMVRLEPEAFPQGKQKIVDALQAEGIPAHPGYTTPLYRQGFWRWFSERKVGTGDLRWKDVFPRPPEDYDLPVTEELCRTTIWLKQDLLLAGPEAMADVGRAFGKVLGAARAGEL